MNIARKAMDSGGGTCVMPGGDVFGKDKGCKGGGGNDDDDNDPAHRRRKHLRKLDDGLEPTFDEDDDDEDDGDYLPVVLPDRVGGPR